MRDGAADAAMRDYSDKVEDHLLNRNNVDAIAEFGAISQFRPSGGAPQAFGPSHA